MAELRERLEVGGLKTFHTPSSLAIRVVDLRTKLDGLVGAGPRQTFLDVLGDLFRERYFDACSRALIIYRPDYVPTAELEPTATAERARVGSRDREELLYETTVTNRQPDTEDERDSSSDWRA